MGVPRRVLALREGWRVCWGMLRPALLLCVLATTACGDSTVLTGPRAEAAVAEAQAQLGKGGQLNIRTTPSDGTSPIILVDGERIRAEPAPTLQSIEPSDIDRIEVKKGCTAAGYFGDEGRSGAIFIYTKSYRGDDVELAYDEERYWACRDAREGGTPRWLHDAQQRHVPR